MSTVNFEMFDGRDHGGTWLVPSDVARSFLPPSAANSTACVTRRPGPRRDVTVDRSTVGDATGRLEPIRRGVYRMAGAPETWEQRLLAACLAAGPEARASFRVRGCTATASKGSHATGLEITHFGDADRRRLDGVDRPRDDVFDGRRTSPRVGRHPGHRRSARTLCDLTAVVRTMDGRARPSTRRCGASS